VRDLRAKPIAVRQTEDAATTKIGVRRDRARPCDDIADALRREDELPGEPIPRDTGIRTLKKNRG
jgi:hypothetical protein